MSDTFRQKIEEIVCKACNQWCHGCMSHLDCPIVNQATDRICAEVEKLAEGMPDFSDRYEGSLKVILQRYRRKCQAFIKEQVR